MFNNFFNDHLNLDQNIYWGIFYSRKINYINLYVELVSGGVK